MKKLLIALTMGAALSTAQATIFYNETFGYLDGALTTQSGGLWVAHSGAAVTPVQVTGGAITLSQGSGTREDVNRATGSTMGSGDIWYAGFDVSVSGGSTAVYFANFLQNSTTFAGRVFVTPATSGGDYTFGFSGFTSTVQSTWASDFTFNSTHRIVVGYDYTGMGCTLWVDPTDQSSTSIVSTGTGYSDAIVAFAFRQAAGNSTEVIDNLVVANNFTEAFTGVLVPEPGTMSLAILGGVALAASRLRRPRG